MKFFVKFCRKSFLLCEIIVWCAVPSCKREQGLTHMSNYHYSDLAKTIIQQLEQKNPQYLDAYDKTRDFLFVYDKIEGTNHWQLFQCIFGNGKNRRKTMECIAMEYCYSSRTLYRYTIKYIYCFEYYLNLLRSETPDE